MNLKNSEIPGFVVRVAVRAEALESPWSAGSCRPWPQTCWSMSILVLTGLEFPHRAGNTELLDQSLGLVRLLGKWRKAHFRFQQSDCAGFMHKMGCLLLKQPLAVCLWVLCHQQLCSWGGFTAPWCQTTNPGCHENLVIKILCFCLLMVPQNSDNYPKHHLTSLPVYSLFIYTHLCSQSAEPRLQKAHSERDVPWLLLHQEAAGIVIHPVTPWAIS